jgi:DNA replication licensing factor MCM3
LETLIRLSTAHAKARLSAKVEEKDVIVAEEILKFALYREVAVKEDRRKRRRTGQADPNLDSSDEEQADGSSDDDDDDEDGAYRGPRPSNGTAPRSTRSQRLQRPNGVNGVNSVNRPNGINGHANPDTDEDEDDEEDGDAEEDTQPTTQQTGAESQLSHLSLGSSMPASQLPPTQLSSQPSQRLLSNSRLTEFRSTLGRLLQTSLFQNDQASFRDVLRAVNFRVDENGGVEFNEREGREALREMGERNEIMWLEDSEEVYKL